MNKTIKRWLSLALAAALAASVSACGKSKAEEEENNDIQISEALSGETLTAGNAADNVFTLAVDLEKPLNPITTTSILNQNVIKKNSKLPLITNVADGYKKLNDTAKKTFDIDLLASDIYSLATDRMKKCGEDFIRPIKVIKEIK